MRPVSVVCLLVAATGGLHSLAAQSRSATVTAGIAYAAPIGALGTYLAPAWGVNGTLAWRYPTRALGLRVDAMYLASPFRAADRRDTLLTLPASVLVSSGGSRFLLSAGPQLMLGRGARRVTAHAAAGVAFASTVMSLAGLGTDDRYTRRKRYTDLAPALQTGAGVSLRLARGIAVDGAVSHAILGPTNYGLDGHIRVGSISGPYWQPRKRWSHILSARLGVLLGQS
jgi:hypothetical protein